MGQVFGKDKYAKAKVYINLMDKRNYFKNIDITKGDFFLLSIFIFYNARASFIADNDYIFTLVTIVLFIIFFIKGKKFDVFIIYFIVIWSLINFFSYILNDGIGFNFITLIGSYLRLFFPYLIMKIIGNSFFDKFVKYIYYLSIIILPIYLLDALNHSYFSSLSPYLNFMTQDEQRGLGGWYIYVYMHSAWAFVEGIPWLYRNCGFMWEAGAYSVMLIFVLTYYLSKNDFKWDKRTIFLVLSLITTFSTSGYISFILILFAFAVITKKKNIFGFLILVTILIISLPLVVKLDFMYAKIENYYFNMYRHYTHFTGVERVNRFGVMYYYFEQALHNPIGNGILKSSYLLKKYNVIYQGPNTLALVLYRWGFIGFFYFLYYIYKFYKRINFFQNVNFFLIVSLLVVLFSNPLDLIKPLVLAIVFYNFMFKKEYYDRKIEQW